MELRPEANIAVVGGGVEGLSAVRWLLRRGASRVTVLDRQEKALPDGVAGRFGEAYLDGVDAFDLFILSPGIPPAVQREIDARMRRGAERTTPTRIFFDLVPCETLGITGSNGKTTCTSMAHAMLTLDPVRKVYLGGNIGIPMLDFVDLLMPEDLVVLEMSSFQLQDLRRSPGVGVILNLTPNHLDHHADVEEYAEAKRQIIAHPSNRLAILSHDSPRTRAFGEARGEGVAWINGSSPTSANWVEGTLVLSVDGHAEEIVRAEDIAVKTHLDTIAAAALAARVFGASAEGIRSVLTTFAPVEHRLERILEKDGISYWDDSSCTTPESAVVAVTAFPPGSAIFLLGGSEKGTPFDALARTIVDRNVRPVLMGQTATKIRDAIHAVDPAYQVWFDEGFVTDFHAVMAQARRLARPGDAIVLSPACASFGMFQNYVHRAAEFRRLAEIV